MFMPVFRRRAAFLLALLLLLCLLAACGDGDGKSSTTTPDSSSQTSSDEPKRPADLSALYADIETRFTLPDMLALNEDVLFKLTGIQSEWAVQRVAFVPMSAISADMLFIFEAADAASLQNLTAKLDSYRLAIAGQMDNYIQSEFVKVNNASVQTQGLFAFLVVSDDAPAICTVIKEALT